MFYLIVRLLAAILCKILFRLQVFGRKNIPLKGGVILASNHTSYLDPPVLGVACPRVLCFLAKEELFKNTLFSRLLANLNTFPVKNQTGDIRALRHAIRELKAGKALAIFPEGRRTADGQLDEPMRGVGLLAAKSGVSIVPAFIKGSNEALPVHSKFIRPKKIKVYFGKALQPAQIRAQINRESFYQKIAEMTMKEISQLKDHNGGG